MSHAILRLNGALEGRYRIERQLGEGGMATVYLADDLRHERKVALKVLKPELAAVVGAERFLAEIKTTANLSHPHILPLHDSGEADGFLFYVMPYVEGESLRDRLDRERQLPVDEAVRVATDLAEALDYAHRHRVIHRDIKPANILMHEGRPLIADFGIALAVGAAGGTRLTETGLSVGTPYYMSPEQATGDSAVGPASDIYALACVLYEMLVGEPPFPGATAQAVLGKIIAGGPVAPTAQRPTIPPHVDAAIRKALEKLPADRFDTAQHFRDALADASFRYGALEASTRVGVPAWWRVSAIALGAATLVLLGLLLTRDGGTSPGVARYHLDLPVESGYNNTFGNHIAISPDGRKIAYTGTGEGNTETPALWIRDRDNLVPRPIPGTELAFHATFSPDGAQVAFVTDDRTIKVASLAGRPPLELTRDTSINRAGLSWADDGQIYFSRRSVPYGISRIPAGGGEPEIVTVVDEERDEVRHYFPDVLPGSRLMLLTVARETNYDATTRDIAVARIDTGETTILFQAIQAHWSPSGHILAVLVDGSLVAVPFEERTLEIGPQIPLFGGIGVDLLVSAEVAISRSGTLVYAPGEGAPELPGLPVWVSRGGDVSPVDPTWRGSMAAPRLSPDGTRLVYADTEGGTSAAFIEVKELDRGPRQRLTSGTPGVGSIRPVWTPDGRRVAYVRAAEGQLLPMLRRADAATAETNLFERTDLQQLEFSSDGRWIVFRGGEDLFLVSPDDGAEPAPLLAEPSYYEGDFAIAPDARSIAYVSNETGEAIVYLRPFPNVDDARVVVSLGPAVEPRWSRDGTELYYRALTGRMMVAARIERGPDGLRVGGREELFAEQAYLVDGRHATYDVHPDGRFLMIQSTEGRGDGLIVVENFVEDLVDRIGG
jgi:serine/threonine-protein kinase